MDPDKALANIRALTAELDRTLNTGKIIELANELSWTVKDLDEWLTNGGFLPAAWNHNRTTG